MDYYCMLGSTPCRAVEMTAKAVGVKLNKKFLNLIVKEQLNSEFVKINPQHTIPTLNDNGFVLWESRAIIVYLVEKYGKDDALFPKDPKKRALINQRLYFDMGTLYQRFADYYYPLINGTGPAEPEKLKKMEEALGFLDTFLEDHTYAAGDTLTLADIALVASVTTFFMVDYDFSKYANVAKWFEHCKKVVPGYEENYANCMELRKKFEEMRKNK